MKRGFNLHSCHIAQQADAKEYISNMLAPSINAQVKSSKTIDELQELMDAGASNKPNWQGKLVIMHIAIKVVQLRGYFCLLMAKKDWLFVQ